MDLMNLPQVEAPLPWHTREWAALRAQISQGKLPHALMLVGSQHAGVAQLALALSRRLLCAEPEGSLNCGHCHACELSARGNHGDFRWVGPQEKSRVVKIDQVRDIVKFSSQTAGFGLRKVIVIHPADSMNVSAFNALLKLLEEPAADTYLILVCHRTHSVPATIRSRCQLLCPATPDTDICLNWLDSFTSGRDESQKLLALADGQPLLAKELYYDGGSDEFAGRRLGLLGILKGSVTVSQASALWNDVEIPEFLQQIATELQRILSSLLMERLSSVQGRAAFRILDEIARLKRVTSAGANPSKQLLVDTLLSKIHRELGEGLLGDTIPAEAGEQSA